MGKPKKSNQQKNKEQSSPAAGTSRDKKASDQPPVAAAAEVRKTDTQTPKVLPVVGGTSGEKKASDKPPASATSVAGEAPKAEKEKKIWKKKDLKKQKEEEEALAASQKAPSQQHVHIQEQRTQPSQQQQAWVQSQPRKDYQQSRPEQQGFQQQSYQQPRPTPQQSRPDQQGFQQQSYQQPRPTPQQSRPDQQGFQQQSYQQQRPGQQGFQQQNYQQPRSTPPNFQQQGQQRAPQPGSVQYNRGGQQAQAAQQFQRRGAQDISQSRSHESQSDTSSQSGRGNTRSYDSRASGGYKGANSGTVAEGSTFKVETNYVDLNIPTNLKEAFHYDVKIDPDKPKKMLRRAVELYCEKQFGNIPVAFDGKSLAYSAVQLPEAKLTSETVEVSLEFGKPKEFSVTLTKTKDFKIDMSVLRTYSSSPSGLADKPMRALQCLEVILAQQCHKKGVKAGRSFFFRPNQPENLLDGYELWYGLFQAAILGERLLLNIDISHKAFPKPSELIDLYHELVMGPYGRQQNFDNLLKGSEILYKPPKSFNQTSKQYKVFAVSQYSANTHKFPTDDGKMITVFDYYSSKGYKIKYADYVLIHVGGRDSKVYLPMELCCMATNQVSNKQTAQRQVSEIIKYSAISSLQRKQKILNLFQYFHAKSSPIIERFGVTLGKEFLRINAIRLVAPKLEYSDRRTVSPAQGSWRTDNVKFYKTAPMRNNSELKWCVVNLEDRLQENKIIQMVQQFIRICQNNRIPIDTQIQHKVKQRNSQSVKQILEGCVSKYDFVIVVLSRYGNSYAEVKQFAELDKGMLTQCIKADTIERRINDATLNNILLKLNSKLNGINQRIEPNSQTGIFGPNKSVMLLGADVTHPSPQQRDIPSIVGTCATSDPDCVRYNMQFRLQDPKKEIIVSMKEIMLEHLNVFYLEQKKYPSHILYYRDGVADGQFEQVLREELDRGMYLAFGEIQKKTNQKYSPKVTCVIVQKRNHTRFFPISKETSFGKYDNVYPGTCVTDTICHPREKEFFLVSHESIKGTARPTKYIVIRDESNFSLDDLKAVSYNLCHLFPRCNRSVSYPAPAYLAHLVAARGKVYIENSRLDMRRLNIEQNKRKIDPRFSMGNPMFFV